MTTHPVPTAWSFSMMKSFENCPKQFYHDKVLKEFPFKETEAIIYGNDFHKACENYVEKDEPLPQRFSYFQPTMDALMNIEGRKIGEQKLGLTRNLEPCGFYDNDVWFRGIADLLIINDDEQLAHVIDYKTGKSARYADPGQLELMGLTVFKHYPQVKKVRSALLFTIANRMVKKTFTVDDEPILWRKWMGKHKVMAKAFETGVWHTRPSGLCRNHCPVLSCPHNGKN